MKILILGGTGLTGPFTIRYLVEQGHQVTIFHRGKHQVDLPPEVKRLLGERRQLDEFTSEFKQWLFLFKPQGHLLLQTRLFSDMEWQHSFVIVCQKTQQQFVETLRPVPHRVVSRSLNTNKPGVRQSLRQLAA